MKNIHVLPTDKPSRLHEFGNIWFTHKEPTECFRNQNIYITNSEEIKDGDWYIYLGQINKRTRKNPKAEYSFPNYKKIILTTDADLIKDGVQAIPDDFLEWFVKNPSCEEVEIEESYSMSQSTYSGIEYEIIIPKEEPNREITFEEVFGEEKKKGLKEFIDKHKKETLDEAVERLFNYHSNNTSLAEGHYDYMMDKEDFKQASYELVKWQQEQDKNKFSAEEVRRIAEWSFHFYKTNEFDDDELEAEWSRILDNDLKKK